MSHTQNPLFSPTSGWRPPALSDLPPDWGQGRVGVDVETRDPRLTSLGIGVRRDGYVVGISFAIEDGPSFYLPIAHQGGDNLPAEAVWAYLRDQSEKFTGTIVGANLSYDLDYLAENGVVFRKAKWFRDVQVAEPIINELSESFSLQAIAERHGFPGKDERVLREAAAAWKIDPKKDMWKLPARFVGEYAEEDAALPLRILRRQERIIEEEDLWTIYDLESKVLPVLVKMRRRGVAIDFEHLARVEDWSVQKSNEALDKVFALSGVRVYDEDLANSGKLAKIFDAMGIEVPMTAKTKKPSIKKEFLKQAGEAGRLVNEARKANKIRTTFAASVRKHETNGRIHCTFNQLRRTKDDGDSMGTVSGRLSCGDPNLQQQPGRDPVLGPFWRKVYIPDDGKMWAANDYSQQEPRLLVHFATKARCRKAQEAADRYINDPNTDSHQMFADLTGLPRKDAKPLYLGKCYSMGGAKLARELGLPTKWIKNRRGNMIEVAGDEAQAIIDKFDNRAPFVSELSRKCEDVAKRRGYIKTLLGRRCRFAEKEGGGYDWTHKALNRLIQGSAADQTKAAMVEYDAQGGYLQLQVHDELDTSVASREEAEHLAEIMRTVTPLIVPSKVDVELGQSWGHSMEN